ncbi:MAG: hypothetical protein D6715_01585 [Calditrichaeota bacterium]|nr:MAG: hypothetical protein D6715_01585 [Calditrichota bacterium]
MDSNHTFLNNRFVLFDSSASCNRDRRDPVLGFSDGSFLEQMLVFHRSVDAPVDSRTRAK